MTETNTVVFTTPDGNISDALEPLAHWLENTVLRQLNVDSNNALQLTVLPSFKRIILVCPQKDVAALVVRMHAQDLADSGIRCNYSMTNTQLTVQHLQVPKSKTVYLVSPPASPPPEFDFAQCEEAPAGASSASSNTPLGPIVQTAAGSICLQRRGSTYNPPPSISEFHTAMPPRSIFDEDSD